MGSPAEAAAETKPVTGLLLDEMYPPSLAQSLRDGGHDVVAALEIEVGLAARTDEDVRAKTVQTKTYGRGQLIQENTLPSSMVTRRGTAAATSRSWVMTTIAVPSA